MVGVFLDGIYKENSKIFEKNSFGSIELIEYLKEINSNENLESIEFVGICTDICVVTNVLMVKGHLPEIPLFVDSKACSGVTPQSHKEALNTMRMCHVKIV